MPPSDSATGAVTGAYSDRLDRTVNDIKQSEERRHEYMVTMIREMEIRAEERDKVREEEREKVRKEEREKGIEQGREAERVNNVRAMFASGMSVESIANILKADVSLIRKWCGGAGQ